MLKRLTRTTPTLFEQHGLDPAGDPALGVSGWAKHMALYRDIDVALDPMPYSGATTSCEALLMGVPVVTLAGADMVERLTASVLAAGCSDWIATTRTDYIDVATELVPDQKSATQPCNASNSSRNRFNVPIWGSPNEWLAN